MVHVHLLLDIDHTLDATLPSLDLDLFCLVGQGVVFSAPSIRMGSFSTSCELMGMGPDLITLKYSSENTTLKILAHLFPRRLNLVHFAIDPGKHVLLRLLLDPAPLVEQFPLFLLMGVRIPIIQSHAIVAQVLMWQVCKWSATKRIVFCKK